MRRLAPLGHRSTSVPQADADEFVGLFWRHGAAVHSYLSRRVGRQQADDLLEEVRVRAFRSRHRYDNRLPAQPWLYGIARKVLLGHFRSRHSILTRIRGDPTPAGPTFGTRLTTGWTLGAPFPL
jgi:DNA-directed RNA polymerase specialized sigma24 family protein